MVYNFTYSVHLKTITNVYNYLQNYLDHANGIQTNHFKLFSRRCVIT